MAFQKASNGLMGGPHKAAQLAWPVITTTAFYSGVFGENFVTRVAAPDFSGQGFLRDRLRALRLGNSTAFSMGLVTSMCFFGAVGYAVFLRDMLMPITELVFQLTTPQPGPTMEKNNILC
jgi:hypothetical protein